MLRLPLEPYTAALGETRRVGENQLRADITEHVIDAVTRPSDSVRFPIRCPSSGSTRRCGAGSKVTCWSSSDVTRAACARSFGTSSQFPASRESSTSTIPTGGNVDALAQNRTPVVPQQSLIRRPLRQGQGSVTARVTCQPGATSAIDRS